MNRRNFFAAAFGGIAAALGLRSAPILYRTQRFELTGVVRETLSGPFRIEDRHWRFQLVPVGQDWDGTFRPITELSYTPKV